MQIALIQTPVEDFYYTPQRSYPLGLTYLAAAVKDLPIKTEIVDLISGYGRHTIKIPDNFKKIQNILPYDHSPISAFHTYYHFGARWEVIEDYFINNNFDLYAISSNFYTYSREVLHTARIIKEVNPSAVIVVGGQNVGPEHTLFTDSPDIDHCIRGEGDISFRNFVNALLDNRDPADVPGIFNRHKRIWNLPAAINDPDIRPSSLLSPDVYSISGKPAIMLSTSRGCPMGCRFCSVSRTFGDKLKLKSPDTIIDEVKEAYHTGIRAFDIEDDNFTFNKEHCLESLNMIANEFEGRITLYAMNGLSAEHLDEEIIDLLYRSGMKLLNLSIATVSEDQLKALHRKTSVDHFKHISRYAASKGMKVIGHFIAGLPGQSIDEVVLTMRVLSELPLVLGISPFYYIPGMNLKVPTPPQDCRDARLSRFWPSDQNIDELDLITLFRLSRWINYLKGEMTARGLKRLGFDDIENIFSGDPFVDKLIKDHALMGLDAQDKLFRHKASVKILDSFFGIFKSSYVYCA